MTQAQSPPPDRVERRFVEQLSETMARRKIPQRVFIGQLPYHPDAHNTLGAYMTKSVISRIFANRRFPKPAGHALWYAQKITSMIEELGAEPEDVSALEEEIAAIELQLDAANSETDPSTSDEKELPEPTMLSRAAIRHFGLHAHPFTDDVQCPDDVFLSTEQRYIRESMWYAAGNSGLIAVIGESGSGKTTLRRDLIDRINRDEEAIVVLQPEIVDKTCLTAGHICDAIIADLSDERPVSSLEAKARQVKRILSDSSRAGNRHVLIIEEAHDLKIQTLKYLKRFWEMEDGFRRLLGIIMVGQPELAHKLDERRNFGARELIRRCEVATLSPLNGNLRDYLALKLQRVGGDVDRIFSADAFDAIKERLTIPGRGRNSSDSYCYPLVVHNLVARAMNNAVDLGFDQIDAEQIAGI